MVVTGRRSCASRMCLTRYILLVHIAFSRRNTYTYSLYNGNSCVDAAVSRHDVMAGQDLFEIRFVWQNTLTRKFGMRRL